MTRTVSVDFDGVIHAYSRGWHDGSIYDPPLPGAIEGVTVLLQHFAVVIHTTRDAEPVAAWLAERGLPTTTEAPEGPFWGDRDRVLVTNRKMAAVAYLDDRAVRFTNWPKALDMLVGNRQPVER